MLTRAGLLGGAGPPSPAPAQYNGYGNSGYNSGFGNGNAGGRYGSPAPPLGASYSTSSSTLAQRGPGAGAALSFVNTYSALHQPQSQTPGLGFDGYNGYRPHPPSSPAPAATTAAAAAHAGAGSLGRAYMRGTPPPAPARPPRMPPTPPPPLPPLQPPHAPSASGSMPLLQHKVPAAAQPQLQAQTHVPSQAHARPVSNAVATAGADPGSATAVGGLAAAAAAAANARAAAATPVASTVADVASNTNSNKTAPHVDSLALRHATNGDNSYAHKGASTTLAGGRPLLVGTSRPRLRPTPPPRPNPCNNIDNATMNTSSPGAVIATAAVMPAATATPVFVPVRVPPRPFTAALTPAPTTSAVTTATNVTSGAGLTATAGNNVDKRGNSNYPENNVTMKGVGSRINSGASVYAGPPGNRNLTEDGATDTADPLSSPVASRSGARQSLLANPDQPLPGAVSTRRRRTNVARAISADENGNSRLFRLRSR